MPRLAVFILITFAMGCSTATTLTDLSQRDWTETPDYGQLRQTMGWAEDFYDKCETDRPTREMVEDMNSEKWEAAAFIGARWLSQCPVDMRVHYYTGIALSESGRESEAEHHFRWFQGLMESVIESGDGRSPETAFETISIGEGYDLLYFSGLRRVRQALVREPVLVDLITATNEDGEEFSIYLNPAAHFYRLSKMLD